VFVVGIIGAVVITALAVTAVSRRRAHDDVHSVEHYHRQLHTLEGMSAHPAEAEAGAEGEAKAAFPESAFRVTSTATVRLTDPTQKVVPPVAPPKVANPSELVKFDDARPAVSATGSVLPGKDDHMMDVINRRPRRLAAPGAAVTAVTILIIVLLVTGSHQATPPKHHKAAATSSTTTPTKSRSTHQRSSRSRSHHQTTTPTTPLLVSLPVATSTHAANYTVGPSTYSLVLSATSSSCWVDATDSTTGSILFTGVLTPGQAHTVVVSGPVSVVSGAPGAFAATVNGSAVTLPYGFQAPFTLHFVPTTT
jgi:hypothetical protein